jgi:hypothetical protein
MDEERKPTPTTRVIRDLSEIIFNNLILQHDEEWFPRADADMMNEVIKFHKERAAKLRVMRDEFETLMAAPMRRAM